MPATLASIFMSTRRIRRKQHVWMTDTGISPNQDMLTQITPYRGTKIVAFSFTVPGLTQFTIRNGRKIGPIPHREIIAFVDCNILPDGESPKEGEENKYFQIAYKGDNYWIEKINLDKQKALIRCDCFTGDTQVLMGDGTKKSLEELEGKTDFEVIAYNEDTNKFEIAFGKKCEKKSENSELLKITLDNGKEIKTTLNHLFLTKLDGWVQAKDLCVGQSLKAIYGYEEDGKLYQNNDNKDENLSNRNWLRIRRFNNSEDYYVYLYLDPRKPGEYKYDGLTLAFEPIYVGKGKNNRCMQHLTNRLHEDTYFYRKLNKIISEGYEPIIVKQSVGLTENLAFQYEQDLIKQIGTHIDNSGPLTNNTFGGEGGSGLIQSKKVIDRMKNNNPMSNPKIAEQQVATSIERGWYIQLSNNMKKNNPMSNYNTVQKRQETMRKENKFSHDRMSKMANARTKETFEQIMKSRIIGAMIETIKKYGEFNPDLFIRRRNTPKIETIIAKGWYNELLEKANQEAFYNHKIIKIERIENAPTYCITVEGLGNFVIATPDKDSNLFSGVVVKNCKDFIMTGAYYDFRHGCLWGPPPKPYIRKTPPPPNGRPYRNPQGVAFMCKHIYYIWRNFMVNRRGEQFFA